ncbi:MAG: DUF11 domain-containing protein [Flavobacteriales bacterium]|nr:MAG: DUF11 domain-containing protein [Flavobacteriales bacterium]
MKKIILIGLLTCCLIKSWAQAPTYINTTFNINAGIPLSWYGDVIFGPNAVVYIEDGATALFYGKNMEVDPGARFIALPGGGQTGTGVIIFRAENPLYPGYPLQQTLNGGYSSGIDPSIPNMEIDNPLGVSLTGNTRISGSVAFSRGHLYLNGFNVVLGSSAALSGYDAGRHVVTNGTGVVVKEGIAGGGSFVFPVSIGGTDYTPATVLNRAGSRSISVQVKDYSTSASVETVFAGRGMGRTWQISSNVAGAANVSLQHNTASNTNGNGTDQGLFNNMQAYVSQQQSPGVWSESCTGANGGTPISVTTGENLVLPSGIGATAYFTKRTVTCTDLMVSKTVSNGSPSVGSTLTFTIDVRNQGTGDATGVVVNDLLPSGYDFGSFTASTGSYVPATGIWTVGNLANGAAARLTVTAVVRAGGSYANTATVTGSETDPDPGNNSSTATPVPGALQANLGVLKTADSMAPVIGSTVVFTIVAKNEGPDQATGVQVADQLPAGYAYISSTATTGAFSSATGIWTIGTLANGASAILTVSARVNATGPYANTATISGTENDPVPGNNSSTVTPVPNAALVDLAISKTAPMVGTAIGESFDYTIEVRNKGLYVATGVVATDILPAGLTFVEARTAFGSAGYSAGSRTVSWNLGSLAAGASATLTLRVKADVAGRIVNTATVASTEQDSNPSDNSSAFEKEVLGLKIPNVITPDGDGRNDSFRIQGLDAYAQSTMTIFNRWGNEVWHSTGARYQHNWTGEGLSEGTYYYILKLRDSSGAWQVLKGWVTLLRD